MFLLFLFSHSTPGALIYIRSVCSVCLYRSLATNFLLTVPISYIGSGFFGTWCQLVNKDSSLVLKQITFTLLLASHRSTRIVPCISPPNQPSACIPLCLHWILRSFELMTILSLTDFFA